MRSWATTASYSLPLRIARPVLEVLVREHSDTLEISGVYVGA